MSLVKLLGFRPLPCGCLSGRYLEIGLNREVQYIEEKGQACPDDTHQRNQPLRTTRAPRGFGAMRAG